MRTAEDLARLAAAVRSASGISLKPHQYDSLDAALSRACGSDAPFEGSAALPSGSDLLERVIDEVAVKETTFLRDRLQLESIDWQLLLERAHARGNHEIQIWSAGCATGEEAYSLALLAYEAFPLRKPPVRIIGTDLSATALEAARIGRYRDRALREVDQSWRERYFSRDHNGYVVNDDVRQLVQFQRHNLVIDKMPPPGVGECVMVICRNVFIYFDPPVVEHVLAGFRNTLVSGGVMILGASDVLAGISRALQTAPVRPFEAVSRVAKSPVTAGTDRERKTPSNSYFDRASAIVDDRIMDALKALSRGERDEALELANYVLVSDPLDPNAYFIRGLVELESGRPAVAVISLRAALYSDPTFGLAAFMLGRALDMCGARPEARRAYEQSLRVLDFGDRRHEYLLAQVGLDDIAAACRLRLALTP